MFREAISPPALLEKRASIGDRPISSINEEAFYAFYRTTAPALHGYIRKNCRSAALSEDILQDAFYRFLRADLPKMSPLQMKTYLFKTATSLLIDHWRREKREKFWKELWKPPEVRRKEPQGDVSQALSKLKPAERALLVLAYVEGFEHSEIASTLGLKEKSIRVLLFRARKKLARILGRRPGNYGATL